MTTSKKQQKENLKNAHDLLDEIVKIQLRPSAIHGVGVFALRDIRRGEKLYTDIIPHKFDLPYAMVKKLPKEIREILLGHFPLITQGSLFMYPVTKFAAFLNHSDKPNYDAVNDKALRHIKEDEEVTEDYRLIPGWEEVFPWLVRDTI